jgi:GEVED domain/Pregnancy-associated plasma protein-A/Secretion system C-terminal sorting domain/Fibronectin type III domain
VRFFLKKVQNQCKSTTQTPFFQSFQSIEHNNMKNIIFLILINFGFIASLSAQTKYTIPVVVHVISPTATSLVTEQEIKDALKNLNLQFKGLYAKTLKDKIITPHRNLITEFGEIQFKLATRDTNNNATTGITYTTNANWSNDAVAYERTFKPRKQWNPRRYMNLYVVGQLNSDKQSGVAYNPDEIGGSLSQWAFLDGVMVDYRILPNTLPLKAPRWTGGYEGVLAHEVAHYLSLVHTMGKVNGTASGCNDPLVVAGDGVDDTPRHANDMAGIAENATEAQRTVASCDNQTIMIDNFLCYSKTQRMFTAGQIQRMKNVLNAPLANRNNLWTTANLTLVGLANDVSAPSAITNLTASNKTLNSITLKWNRATDNQAVLGYDIYRDSVFFASTIDSSYVVSNLKGNTQYRFTVRTRDFDNNLSADSVTLNVKTLPHTYCSAAGITQSNTIEWIRNVTFNTLNHSSSDRTAHYQNYTNQRTTVNQGSTYALTVTLDSIWNADNDHDYIVAWADWNNNGVFDTTEEYVLTPQYMTTKSATLNITVPTNAVKDTVRLRIRSIWNGSNTLTSYNACGSATYGEVEDYALVVAAPNANPPVATYCTTAGTPISSLRETINNVKFNTINNSSTARTVYYEDFTATSTSVQRGRTYPLIVTLDDVWNANNDHDYIVAWVDWNNNKVFEATERIVSNRFVGSSKKDTLQVAVPSTAVLGNVRMRVRSVWNGSNSLTTANPCGTTEWGQVEDYMLNVTAAAARLTNSSAIERPQTTNKMTVYPNPTTGILNIDMQVENVNIEILDLTGRTMLRKMLNQGTNTLDISHLQKGVYVIKASEGGIKITKIVVH